MVYLLTIYLTQMPANTKDTKICDISSDSGVMNHDFPLTPLIFLIIRDQLWLIRYLNPNIFPLDSDDFKGQFGVPLPVYTHGICCVP